MTLDAVRALPFVSEPLPGVITAGQPSAAHLAAFKAAGGSVVLDMREAHEPRGYDEAAEAARLGLTYVHVPVGAGANTRNDRTLERVRSTLREAPGPVLVHCASANRVGGALLPVFILDHGMTEDDAIEAALRVGLRAQDLAVWALEYARRHATP
ncbi:MAG TPA: sulfur transferase domain-containing protein [Gemmatimonadales bacterium]|nr:sulfur transferase domain-containing protein [Gemmatimonadales bacterium]